MVRGKYDEKGPAGEVDHFQALTAAVSGMVGLGNIAGVAVAVSIGGPGATFWMILCGLLGMATKFVEVTLGVKYREVHADGTVSGGPTHYLPKGLADRFGKTLGKVLAVLVLFMLAVINIIGLYLLAPVVKRELNSFLEFVRARNAHEVIEGDGDDEEQESVKTTA